jgi:hypothetical protein
MQTDLKPTGKAINGAASIIEAEKKEARSGVGRLENTNT